MKKITLLFIAIITFLFNSCSSDDSNDVKKVLPEKFDIKIDVKGSAGSIYKTHISINGFGGKEWKYIDFPFEGSYTYYTTGNEINNTACKCITISAWAYIDEQYKIESFNLYVDGKLVDTTNKVAPTDKDGFIAPTTLEFVYTP
ncbi:hypothetical protein QLS91_13170 [Flavobacterium sp. LB2P84]|uniref:hypothetical protein n=1 Tax=Flavobacterium yafengii TaxID=3041253 RepID=UPI0024A941A2|nr:hypothetical protein [Flavobacterium yafengii]MDI6034026.1 hypothetical protein [Flavobacterium yafengii]